LQSIELSIGDRIHVFRTKFHSCLTLWTVLKAKQRRRSSRKILNTNRMLVERTGPTWPPISLSTYILDHIK
jgi:hypothetical protein